MQDAEVRGGAGGYGWRGYDLKVKARDLKVVLLFCLCVHPRVRLDGLLHHAYGVLVLVLSLAPCRLHGAQKACVTIQKECVTMRHHSITMHLIPLSNMPLLDVLDNVLK